MSERICAVCGDPVDDQHDHAADGSGLDDGPFLPGRAPRKRATPKPPEELKSIRAKAWTTRRAKARGESS